MSLDKIISQAVSRAVAELYAVEVSAESIVPQATRKEFEGNLTVVVFPFLKASRKSPEATATELGEWLVANEAAVEKFNVVKGFLNISIKSDFWIDVLNDVANADNFGIKPVTDESQLVMV